MFVDLFPCASESVSSMPWRSIFGPARVNARSTLLIPQQWVGFRSANLCSHSGGSASYSENNPSPIVQWSVDDNIQMSCPQCLS